MVTLDNLTCFHRQPVDILLIMRGGVYKYVGGVNLHEQDKLILHPNY